MIFQVLRQVGDHLLHLVVLEHQIFGSLGLVVELSRQLGILYDSQSCRTLKLILISHRVLHTDGSNLHEHVLS